MKFKNWVTSEVLPQIRKTGGYIPVKQGESDEETIRHAEEILRATLKEKENLLKKQQVQIDQQKKLIGEQDTEIRIRHAEEILRATLKEKENLLKKQQVQIDQQKKLIGEQDTEIRRLNGVVDEQVVCIAKNGENIIQLENQVLKRFSELHSRRRRIC